MRSKQSAQKISSKKYIPSTTQRQTPFYTILLAIAFTIGGFFRFYNLNWDSGHYFHSDERNLSWAVTRIRFFSHMNPEFFSYGSFPIYLYRIGAESMAHIKSDPSWTTDWAKITLVGRYFSATFSFATLFVMYRIAMIATSPFAALLTVWFTAFMPLLIQQAHFSITESMMTFWGALLTLICLSSIKQKRQIPSLLVGVLLGLASATKVSAISLVSIPLITLSIGLLQSSKSKKIALGTFFFMTILMLLYSIVTYIIVSPYTFLDWSSFIKALRFESRVALGYDVWVYVYQFIGTTSYLYPLKQFFYTQGVLLGLIAPLGLLYCAYKAIKTKSWTLIILFIWPICYFLYVGQWFTKFVRYLAPIYPFFAVATAILLDDARDKFKLIYTQEMSHFVIPSEAEESLAHARTLTRERSLRVSRDDVVLLILLVPIFSIPFLQALAFFHIYIAEQTRITASRWIYTNIPAGSKIFTEHWDEGLPIPLSQGLTPIIFDNKQLEIYQPDNDSKLQYYANNLSSADYIIINSRRLYGTLIHMISRYPITSRYYQKLFDGSLGFKKIAEFSVYPTIFIGPWSYEINDDHAEESFQVYDHPKAMVFKNTAHHSMESIVSLLMP